MSEENQKSAGQHHRRPRNQSPHQWKIEKSNRILVAMQSLRNRKGCLPNNPRKENRNERRQ